MVTKNMIILVKCLSAFRRKITEHHWIKARSTVKYNEGPEGGISIPLKLFNPQFPFFPILSDGIPLHASDLNPIFPEQQHPILPLRNSPQWIQCSTLPSKQISILTNEQLYVPATAEGPVGENPGNEVATQPFLVSSRNAPPHKRLLKTELHSFPFVFVV